MKITFKKVVSPCLFIGVIILKKGEKPIISFYKIPDIVLFFFIKNYLIIIRKHNEA
ncbi:protein of unknown function [Tenacibaculum sp. 190524A02b]